MIIIFKPRLHDFFFFFDNAGQSRQLRLIIKAVKKIKHAILIISESMVIHNIILNPFHLISPAFF